MTTAMDAEGLDPVALASEGPAATRHDWEEAAATVLRKARRLGSDDPDNRVWSALTTTTLDGIQVPPLGTRDDVPVDEQTLVPGEFPFTRGRLANRPSHGWDLRCHVGGLSPESTRDAALLDLEGGATSLWLYVGGPLAPADLAGALEGVHLDLAAVVLDCPTDPVGAATALTNLLTARGSAAAAGTNLGADPFAARVRNLSDRVYDGEGDGAGTGEGRSARRLPDVHDTLVSVAELATEHGTLAVMVDGAAVHDRGASDAQELGYSLAVGAAYLRVLTAGGRPVAEALSLMEFRYCATDEQLVTIAKLRAARRLWARVAELSQAPAEACGQRQHAMTSRAMMSTREPYVNLLRTSVAAFAAGVGGADAVTVLPFDSPLGLPSSLGRRAARNTSSLLVWESHVGAVSDPAGGSFAVERLTDQLARAAWSEFDRIERGGGVEASLADGSLLTRVDEIAHRRAVDVAHRRRPLTGLSEFPDPDQSSLDRQPDPCALPVRRYGAGFERLQHEPASQAVFLATLGPLAAHTARSSFATNLFAAGGMRVTIAGATDGVEAVLAAYDGAPVVCLCGTDAAYAEHGAETIAALRGAGARWVVLAGRPGERTVPEHLVDDAAIVGDDALALLTRTRERMA